MNKRKTWHFNQRLYAKVRAAKMKIAAESLKAIIEIKEKQNQERGKDERRHIL